MRKLRFIGLIFFIVIFLSQALPSLATTEEEGNNSSDETRDKSLEAIIYVNTPDEPEDAWDLIEEGFQARDANWRKTTINFFRIGDEKAEEKMVSFLVQIAKEDEYPEVRLAAIRRIIHSPHRDSKIAIDAISHVAIKDEHPENRIEALELIKIHDITPALPSLKNELPNVENERVKDKMNEAIEYLKNVMDEGLEDKFDIIKHLLDSPESSKRQLALEKIDLSLLSDPRLKTVLIEAYEKETDKEIKYGMLILLPEIAIEMIIQDKDIEDIISILKREAKSKNKYISEVASDALEGIEELLEDTDALEEIRRELMEKNSNKLQPLSPTN